MGVLLYELPGAHRSVAARNNQQHQHQSKYQRSDINGVAYAGGIMAGISENQRIISSIVA